MNIWGAIEAGGTKFKCAIGNTNEGILSQTVIKTTFPNETIEKVIEFFGAAQKTYQPLSGIGVGCFGPLDINTSSFTYGQILSTPKKGWNEVNIVALLSKELLVPIVITTDVNCSAMGELRYGAARGLSSFAYVTIGTGIGGAIYSNGNFLSNNLHPELGHMSLNKSLIDSEFSGSCPFHGDCAEGLASGTAIKKRWGKSAQKIGSGHLAWTVEADYIAKICMNITATCCPQKIILGGGVMEHPGLISMVKNQFTKLWANYLETPSNFIVSPGMGGNSALIGGFILIEDKMQDT
jgi:fructokinase